MSQIITTSQNPTLKNTVMDMDMGHNIMEAVKVNSRLSKATDLEMKKGQTKTWNAGL